MFLSIVLHIYFVINIFMAGYLVSEDCDWRKAKANLILSAIVWTLFWCLVMAASSIVDFVRHLWKRSWIKHYINLRKEEKEYLTDKRSSLTILELKALKTHREKKLRTLPFIKRRGIAVLDHQIELYKNELRKYGELEE